MADFSASSFWAVLRQQALDLSAHTPALGQLLRATVLDHASFQDALADRLAGCLQSTVPQGMDLPGLFSDVLQRHPTIASLAQRDLTKLADTNPACPDYLTGLLSFRGLLALELYRINHALWGDGQMDLSVLLQNWGALSFAVDIHPAAVIGAEIFLDHGIGIVVGSTAVIEDGANIWHGVTLGSTLTQAGDRHPKVRRNVTIGAGATILGNIEIGEGAIIAAGSVVLRAVDPFTVVAGVPARPVGSADAHLDAIAKKT